MVLRTSMLFALLVIAGFAVFISADETCDPNVATACSNHQDACKGTCTAVPATECKTDDQCTTPNTDTCSLKCKCPEGLSGDECQTKSSSSTTRGSISCLMLMFIPTMIQLVRL